MRRALGIIALQARNCTGTLEAVAAGRACNQQAAVCSTACASAPRGISMSAAASAAEDGPPADDEVCYPPAQSLIPFKVLSDGEVRKLLQTMNKGSSISDRQLECFKAACGTDNNGTMEISSGRLGAIDAALTDPEYPIALSKLLGPDSKAALAEQMLKRLLHSVSDATKKDLVSVMSSTNRQNFMLFLCRHLELLSHDKPDTVLRQLMQIYDLHCKPVTRSFEQGPGGALHPAVSWSAMKPLHVEMSHRVGTVISLFEPQRITLGSFIDFSKVVRPLRAKNYIKRTKFKNFRDIYYAE